MCPLIFILQFADIVVADAGGGGRTGCLEHGCGRDWLVLFLITEMASALEIRSYCAE